MKQTKLKLGSRKGKDNMSVNLPTIKVANTAKLPKATTLYMGTVAEDGRGFKCFRMLKFDSTGTYMDTYTIRGEDANPAKTVCTCPAYVDNCRHKRMLRQLIRHGGLNSDRVIGVHNKALAWYELPEPLLDPDLLTV